MINGYAIAASDGRLGTVSDFLFDDASWLIRWLAADTSYLALRSQGPAAPPVRGQLDPKGCEFSIKLTMQQVKGTALRYRNRSARVSVADGDQYLRLLRGGPRIGVPAFTWAASAMWAAPGECHLPWGLGGARRKLPSTVRNDEDPHLRSIGTVSGYRIHANDGEIGHVEDFLGRGCRLEEGPDLATGDQLDG